MSKLSHIIKESSSLPILGVAALDFDPAFVEIAAYLGFESLWIEMEHAHITFSEAANLCRIASGLGMLTMIRIPDARRENVLKAAECGPDIIDVPMANTREIIEELVRHARYAPEGNRGFFGSSRGVRYSMFQDTVSEQKRVNSELCLMAQIETIEAVQRAEELCSVPGLDAIFIGPCDLSASMGLPGETKHPEVVKTIESVISTAKKANKILAIACPADETPYWASRGIELIFCASNISCIKLGLEMSLDMAKKKN